MFQATKRERPRAKIRGDATRGKEREKARGGKAGGVDTQAAGYSRGGLQGEGQTQTALADTLPTPASSAVSQSSQLSISAGVCSCYEVADGSVLPRLPEVVSLPRVDPSPHSAAEQEGYRAAWDWPPAP